MKRTQGEWEIKVGTYPNSYFLQTVVTDEEAEANAQLMEASPLLLDALEIAIGVIKQWHGDVDFDIYYHHAPEMISIREAIAKATGETKILKCL